MSASTTYPCHVIHPSLPKGKASGEMTVSSVGVAIDVKGQKASLDFYNLEISQGGASDRLVFFNHPAKADWRIYTSDRSVLKNPILQSHDHLKTSMGKARKKRASNWLLLAAVVFICLATPVAMLANMDVASRLIAEQVPAEWEEKLGESSFDQYSLQVDLMDQEQAATLLDPMVQPLLEALPDRRFEYTFHISNDSQLNAFALPGGIVVINSGLILAAESAEEVLGVVGHEIAHVRERHGVRNLISSSGTYLIISALLGDVSGVMAIVVDAAPLLINQGYSRKFESESDRLGFEYLQAANVDPSGLSTFFEKLMAKEQERREKAEAEGDSEWLKTGLSFLSSHPATEDRIAELQERNATATGEYRDFTAEFSRLKAAVSEFAVEDESEADL